MPVIITTTMMIGGGMIGPAGADHRVGHDAGGVGDAAASESPVDRTAKPPNGLTFNG
jgi:hypothetical protein